MPGRDICIYLADERELPTARGLPPDVAADPAAGRPIEGSIELDLAGGPYWVAIYDPSTGLYSPAAVLEGGNAVSLRLPPFTHDLVIRLTQQ